MTTRGLAIGNNGAVKLTTHAKPGYCRCLRCGKRWKSPDLKHRRICDECTWNAGESTVE